MVGIASRQNGKLGGRPRTGKLPPEVTDARKAVRLSLQERCRKNELRHVQILEQIAEHSTYDNVRIAAINALWDRGHGRPAQAITGADGAGPVIMQVITGVPEPDDGPVIEHHSADNADDAALKASANAAAHVAEEDDLAYAKHGDGLAAVTGRAGDTADMAQSHAHPPVSNFDIAVGGRSHASTAISTPRPMPSTPPSLLP